MIIQYLAQKDNVSVVKKEKTDLKTGEKHSENVTQDRKVSDKKTSNKKTSNKKINTVDHNFRYLSQTRPNIVGKVRIYDKFEEVLNDRNLLKDNDTVCLDGTYYKIHLHTVHNSGLSEEAELSRQQKKHPSWMFLDIKNDDVDDIERVSRKRNLEGELSRADDDVFDKGDKYKNIAVIAHLPKLNHRITQYVVYLKVKGNFLYFYNLNGISFGHIRITDAGHTLIKRYFEYQKTHGKGKKDIGQSQKRHITSWTKDLLKIINSEINRRDSWDPVIETIGDCLRDILGNKFYIERTS